MTKYKNILDKPQDELFSSHEEIEEWFKASFEQDRLDAMRRNGYKTPEEIENIRKQKKSEDNFLWIMSIFFVSIIMSLVVIFLG